MLVAIIFMSSCGIPVHVDGGANGVVTGQIYLTLDISQLTSFFTADCQQKLGTNATTKQIQDCATTETSNFITFLEGFNGLGNTPSPTPLPTP